MRSPLATSAQRVARLAIYAAIATATTVLTACTGSGSSTTPTTPATGASSSHTTTPRSTGPTATRAKPASFGKVSAKKAKKVEQSVVQKPGVQSVSYVPSSKTVQVYYSASSTAKQRQKVAAIVHRTLASTAKHKHH